MKAYLASSLLGSLLILGGCVSLPVIPGNGMPLVNRPEIFAPLSPATGWLRCLSNDLGQEKGATIKIAIADVPNTFGGQIPGLNLPASLRPFINKSFNDITNVYRIIDNQSVTSMQGLSGSLQNFGGAPEGIIRDAIAVDKAPVDYYLTGSLYMALESKNASAGGEIYSVGASGKVVAYDISAQLQANHAATREKVASVSLTVRMYSAEQGVNLFRLTDGELAQGQLSFGRAPSVSQGIQYLSDFLVAALVRDLSSAAISRSFSSCDNEIDGPDNSKVAVQARTALPLPLKLELSKSENNGLCIKTVGNPGSIINSNENLQVIFQQYASNVSLDVPLGPAFRDRVQAEKILKGSLCCLPSQYIDQNAKNIEVRIYNDNQKILGVVADSL